MILVVGSVLTIVGALGVAYAVFRTNVVTKTVDLYKTENEILGKTVARLGSDLATCHDRIATIEDANRVLRETVTGERAIQALSTEIRAYQQPVAEAHRMQLDALNRILAAIRDLGGRVHE